MHSTFIRLKTVIYAFKFDYLYLPKSHFSFKWGQKFIFSCPRKIYFKNISRWLLPDWNCIILCLEDYTRKFSHHFLLEVTLWWVEFESVLRIVFRSSTCKTCTSTYCVILLAQTLITLSGELLGLSWSF